MITNQKDLRRAFWEAYPDASKRKLRDGDYCTDTRLAFNDYCESLRRDGVISEALAYRVTL
jgi:hypothetical protein